MITILLHSSKTMQHTKVPRPYDVQEPLYIEKARELRHYLLSLSSKELQQCMNISPSVAAVVARDLKDWLAGTSITVPALDAFLGDIYSGLQVHTFSEQDRIYADAHLYILSGLYGVLRALDIVEPYRLEMGYKLPATRYNSLYKFWGDRIARALPVSGAIINLSAVEYTKAALPYLKNRLVITPKFMTRSHKTNEPVFVTVHAKVARGAYAHWLIKNRVERLELLTEFSDIGYVYDPAASTATAPVFVCSEFGGKGLSVRLT